MLQSTTPSKKEILSYLQDELGRINGKRLKSVERNQDQYYHEIITLTPFAHESRTLAERVRFIGMNLTTDPSCDICSKPTKYITPYANFSQFCSTKCAGEHKRRFPVSQRDYEQLTPKRVIPHVEIHPDSVRAEADLMGIEAIELHEQNVLDRLIEFFGDEDTVKQKIEYFEASKYHRLENAVNEDHPKMYKEIKTNEFYAAYDGFNNKMSLFLYGGGTCLICCKQTKRQSANKAYGLTCSSQCAGMLKRGKVAHSVQQTLDWELIKKLYVEDCVSPEDIGLQLGASAPTVGKVLSKMGVRRTRQEQQSVMSGTKGKIPHNYSGIKSIDFHALKPRSAREVAEQYGVDPSSVYLYSAPQGYVFSSKSYIEDIIKDILTDLNINFTQNTRKIIKPLELDFYMNDLNLAIECNGLFHHSINQKDYHYHYNKFKSCTDKGIQLIQLWEDDIRDNPEKIKSYIKSKLGSNDKVFARQCKLVEVSHSDAMAFYEKYHLQGRTKSGEHKGLKYNDELMSCMSFTSRSDDLLELTRFCTKANITVVGGFSKLLSTKKGFDIVSFSNNDYSDGSVYKTNGFDLVSVNKANMFYTDYKNGFNRERFMKHKLKDMYPDAYDENKTEREILESVGIYQCIGSGTTKWLKRK